MTLLLCHLIGDYVLQSHTMAIRKTSEWRWAAIHAAFYSLPFAALLAWSATSWWSGALAWAVIAGTHALIDRLGIAGMWCRWYGVGHPGVWWRERPLCRLRHEVPAGLEVGDGAHYAFATPHCVAEPATVFSAPPPFLGVWLTIIVDNTMHLAINALAVWLATGAP